MAHGELNLDDRYQCEYCMKSYKYEAGLRKHTVVQHPDEYPYSDYGYAVVGVESSVRPNRYASPDSATLEEVVCVIDDLANMLVRLAGIARKLGHTKF